MLLRTSLFHKHLEAKARMVDFGGWEMPVQYSGIRPEHLMVREKAGVFDISHMGQLIVAGPEASAFLNAALTNDITRLSPGLGQYSLLCHSDNDGGTVDDLYVFQLEAERFLLVINASRREADISFLQSLHSRFQMGDKVTFHNQSDTHSAIALQGPLAESLLSQVITDPASRIIHGTSIAQMTKNQIGGFDAPTFDLKDLLISRTGYTGEDGFEIMAPHQVIINLWELLLKEYAPDSLCPAGLGARDTLRLEAGYPLYGHELAMENLPTEVGLMWAVAMDKPDFSGKSAIEKSIKSPDKRRLIGLEMVDKAPPPRQGYPILTAPDENQPVGIVTSGGLCPKLNKGIALASVPQSLVKPGKSWWIQIRGKSYLARQHKKSFL